MCNRVNISEPCYYAGCKAGDRSALLVGPFQSMESAAGMVARARDLVAQMDGHDVNKMIFGAFLVECGRMPGLLNKHVGYRYETI